MPSVHIKSDDRRADEARTLREYGIDARTATAAQREYAEQITASEKLAKKEFDRMEEKSK
jgi:hypothetical protein